MNNPFQKKQPNHNALAAGILAVIGAAVGVAVAYQNSSVRKEVNAHAKDVAKQFNKNRATIQKHVQEIFGKVSLELEKNYLEVESQVLAAVDHLKTQAKANQPNIEKAIDDIIKNAGKAQKWTQKSVEKFTKMVKAEWARESRRAANIASAAKQSKVYDQEMAAAAKKAKSTVALAKKAVKAVTKKPAKKTAKQVAKKTVKMAKKTAKKSRR